MFETSLTDLIGEGFGPETIRLTADRVADFCEVTSDDPARWEGYGPPGLAGTVLFAVAPRFLEDPRVVPHTAVLIHSDQLFEYHAPFVVGSELAVTSEVTNVRERAGMSFVSLAAGARDEDGGLVIASTSTFIMSSAAADAHPEPRTEPPPRAKSACDRPAYGSAALSIRKSASRLDLVRYAAVSGDFNPIHWDHSAAVTAGMAGIIAHGLFSACWLAQLASLDVDAPAPLRSMKLRFRTPVFPAEELRIDRSLGSEDAARVELVASNEAGAAITGHAVLSTA